MKPIIKNAAQLREHMAYYANMFPGVEPVTYEGLVKSMEDHQDDWPKGLVCGISVSPAWEDKCFGFEVIENSDTSFVIEYTGVTKC